MKQPTARAAWACLASAHPRFSPSHCLTTGEGTVYGWGPGAGLLTVGNRQSAAWRAQQCAAAGRAYRRELARWEAQWREPREHYALQE